MAIEDFKGYQSKRLNMPDGGLLFVFFFKNNSKRVEVQDGNRNVFRLDSEGSVIWQVERIDHPGTHWELKHKEAREQGLPGCIEPFIAFRVRLSGGTTYPDGIAPDAMDWIPRSSVELVNLGFGTQWFSLDVDTGVAVEITLPGKAWYPPVGGCAADRGLTACLKLGSGQGEWRTLGSPRCEPNCTAEDFRRIDPQAAAVERAADLAEAGGLTAFLNRAATQGVPHAR